MARLTRSQSFCSLDRGGIRALHVKIKVQFLQVREPRRTPIVMAIAAESTKRRYEVLETEDLGRRAAD